MISPLARMRAHPHDRAPNRTPASRSFPPTPRPPPTARYPKKETSGEIYASSENQKITSRTSEPTLAHSALPRAALKSKKFDPGHINLRIEVLEGFYCRLPLARRTAHRHHAYLPSVHTTYLYCSGSGGAGGGGRSGRSVIEAEACPGACSRATWPA